MMTEENKNPVGRPTSYIGQTFGRLSVISQADSRGGKTYYNCICTCGNQKTVRGSHLKDGNVTSCGCYGREVAKQTATKHGQSRTKLYGIWHGMRRRCLDPECDHYYQYGGRGIAIDPAFEDFFAFKQWAETNGYQDGLTIERRNVNGNYSIENCTWIPHADQQKNTRRTIHVEINGVTRCLKEWAEVTGMHYTTLVARYHRRGLRGEELIKPV